LGSATAAATSASNAATSETNAANSATAASNSASAASSSASSAAASYDSFDDRYLGPKASAPTVDNDGNTLLTGALYWNTTSSNLFVWSGSAWTSAAFTAGSFATLTGTETLTNKTIEAGTFTNGYTEESFTSTPTSTITVDLANGSVQIITLGGNVTYTFPTPVAGKSFILVQKQDGTGSRTVTWPASVKWPAGTSPTLTSTASRADKFVFTAIDGSSWLGSVAGQNYTV
jgi:hypothetical protein